MSEEKGNDIKTGNDGAAKLQSMAAKTAAFWLGVIKGKDAREEAAELGDGAAVWFTLGVLYHPFFALIEPSLVESARAWIVRQLGVAEEK